jgi:hypothetical protein
MARRAPWAAIAVAALAAALLTAPTSTSVSASGAEAAERKVARCMGKKATIVGTRKKDILIGTRKRDVIVARGGNDFVDGQGRRDLICGGRGHDVLAGGKGRDKITGQRGKDYCQGERREHRHHKSCEAHGPEFNPPTPPDPTRQQLANAPKLQPVPARQAQRNPVFDGNEWFTWEDPWCSRGQIDYNRLYVSGDYTDPAYIYSISMPAYWTPARKQFVPDGTALDRGIYQVPLAGQHHAIPGGVLGIRTGQFSLHGHVTWWWNGAQWVDETVWVPNLYAAAVSFVGICIS